MTRLYCVLLALPGWPPRKRLARKRKKGLGRIQGLRSKRKREGAAQGDCHALVFADGRIIMRPGSHTHGRAPGRVCQGSSPVSTANGTTGVPNAEWRFGRARTSQPSVAELTLTSPDVCPSGS